MIPFRHRVRNIPDDESRLEDVGREVWLMLGGRKISWTVEASILVVFALRSCDDAVTHPVKAFLHLFAWHAVVLEIYETNSAERFIDLACDVRFLIRRAARGLGEIDDWDICHAADTDGVAHVAAKIK